MAEIKNNKHIGLEQLAEELNKTYKTHIMSPIFNNTRYIRINSFLGNVIIRRNENGNFNVNFTIPAIWILFSMFITILFLMIIFDYVTKNTFFSIILFVIVFFVSIYSYYLFFVIRHKNIKNKILKILN